MMLPLFSPHPSASLTPLSLLRGRSGAALTAPRAVIHYRAVRFATLKGKAFVFDVRYIRSNKPGGSHSAGFILYFTSPLPFRARDFISRLPRVLSAPGTISPAFVRAIFVIVGPMSS